MTTATQTVPRARLEELLNEQASVEASIAGRKEALARAIVSNSEGTLKALRRELNALEQRQREIALGISMVEPAAESAAKLAEKEAAREAEVEAQRLTADFVAATLEAETVLRPFARGPWLSVFRKMTAAEKAVDDAYDRASRLNGRGSARCYTVPLADESRRVDFGQFALPLARYGANAAEEA